MDGPSDVERKKAITYVSMTTLSMLEMVQLNTCTSWWRFFLAGWFERTPWSQGQGFISKMPFPQHSLREVDFFYSCFLRLKPSHKIVIALRNKNVIYILASESFWFEMVKTLFRFMKFSFWRPNDQGTCRNRIDSFWCNTELTRAYWEFYNPSYCCYHAKYNETLIG